MSFCSSAICPGSVDSYFVSVFSAGDCSIKGFCAALARCNFSGDRSRSFSVDVSFSADSSTAAAVEPATETSIGAGSVSVSPGGFSSAWGGPVDAEFSDEAASAAAGKFSVDAVSIAAVSVAAVSVAAVSVAAVSVAAVSVGAGAFITGLVGGMSAAVGSVWGSVV